MRLKQLLIGLGIVALALAPSFASAISILPVQQGGTGWGYPGNINPGSILFGDYGGARLGTSTDLSFSTSTQRLSTPFASTTALSATNLCLTGDTCRSTWPTSLTPAGTPGQLQYNSANTTFAAVATSSGSCSGGASCNAFVVVGSGAPTISVFSYPFPISATSSLVTFTGGILVNNASSTIVGNATTTGMQSVGSLYINSQRFLNLLGSGLSNSAGTLTVSGLATSNFTSANISQWTNDSGYITSASSGAAFAYTPATNFAVNSNSTTTPIWYKTGLFASTTNANPIWLDQLQVGSSTIGTLSTSTFYGNLSIRGNASTTALTISGINNNILFANSTGQVIGTSTLSINNGGTGAQTLTSGSILVGNGTGPIQATSTLAANVGGTGQNSNAWTGLALTTAGVWSQYNGSAPCSNQVALSLSASGVISCTSVTNAMLSNSVTNFTYSGNVTGPASIALGASGQITVPFEFTPTTSFGTAANSTTTRMLFTNGVAASSTLSVGNANGSGLFFDSATGRFGLGTSTPYGLLTVFASTTNGVALPQYLFAIASSSAGTATTTLFSVSNTGLVQNTGGVIVQASSTIGTGAANAGLTIDGNATTTGVIKDTGTGTSTFAGGVQTAGTLDAQSTTASSTFSNGITLKGGCFAIGTTCVGAAAAAGASRYSLVTSTDTRVNSAVNGGYATSTATAGAVVVPTATMTASSTIDLGGIYRCNHSNSDSGSCNFYFRVNGGNLWKFTSDGGGGAAANTITYFTCRLGFTGGSVNAQQMACTGDSHTNSGTWEELVGDITATTQTMASGQLTFTFTSQNDNTSNLDANVESFWIIVNI